MSLVSRHGTKGKPAHDARLVACMSVYGIQSILTFVKVKPKTGLANKSITQYISSRFFPH
jgi:hypothetical protein